ncbi:MAG: DUF2142 domain-containing protein [Isosphaeraceae bacterium]
MPPNSPKGRGRTRIGAASVAGLALILGLAWAFRTRPFDAPDEPSHVNAVIQVIRTGRPPIAIFSFEADPKGELAYPPFDRELARAASAAGQGDPLKLSAYESFQPPLYYLIVAAIAGPIADRPADILMIGRLVSVALGAIGILGIWLAARRLVPEEPWLAFAAAGSVALIPQFAFNSATAGNDSLIHALFAWSFASWFRSLRDPTDDRRMVRSGVLVGLAILSKLSAFALLPGLALLVLIRTANSGDRRRSEQLRMALGSIGAISAVSGWWFVRNAWVLGDPLASRDASRYYRSRFVPFSPDSWHDIRALVETTWQSFWGRFGWMNRPLPAACYAATAAMAAGLVVLTIARWRRPSGIDRPAWSLMAAVSAFVVAVFLQINLSIGFQAQGRYLFPAALPIGLLLASGLAMRGDHARARGLGLAIFWAWLLVMQGLGLAG